MTQEEKSVLTDFFERSREQHNQLNFLLNSVHALMFMCEEGVQNIPDGSAAAFLGQFIDCTSAMSTTENDLKAKLGIA